MRHWLTVSWMMWIWLAVAVSAHATGGEAGLRIGAWNIQHLGHGQQKSYPILSHVASTFDFLAIQEVMTAEGVQRLQQQLEKDTGEKWGLLYSGRLGRGSYREKYAFLWREAKVDYVDGAVVYVDKREAFIREPFAARFATADGTLRFVAATVHILYGGSVTARTPEILALRGYWDWLDALFPEDDHLILLGDFNLAPSHEAWGPLKEVARPLIVEGATTLSSIDGRFANLYDNIWVPKESTLNITASGILAFPAAIGWSHEKARRHVSDHAPVYMVVGEGEVSVDSPGIAPPASPKGAAEVERHEGSVRGNRNSMIYHWEACPSYNDIAPRNRVPFESREEAEAAGYRAAGNCP